MEEGLLISRYDAYMCMKESENVVCRWVDNGLLQRFSSSGDWQFSSNGINWKTHISMNRFLAKGTHSKTVNETKNFILISDPDKVYEQYNFFEKYKHMEEIV